MTNKEKLDKLVAEIKRLRKEVKDNIAELGNSESERIGLFKDLEIYDNILSIIDSMQEEPVSENLEEAATKYMKSENPPIWGLHDGFIAGAQWQKEQLLAKAFDGKVLANGMGNPILHLWDKGRHLIDKRVKVIVIKED